MAIKTASAALLVLIISTQAGAERTPPGSFLKWRVSSPDQAAEQVLTDRQVGKLYSAFFDRPAEDVAAYFRSLSIQALDSDIRVRVYFIGRGGKVISEIRNMPRGRMVFSDASGKPVMDHRCGNPFIKTLPEKKNPAKPNPLTREPETLSEAIVSSTYEQIVPAPIFESTVVTPALEFVAPSIEIITTVSGGSPGWLIPLIPLINGGGSDKPPVIPPVEPPAPVPEPASVIMSGLGLAAALKTRFRRKAS